MVPNDDFPKALATFVQEKVSKLSSGSPWSRAMLSKLRRAVGTVPGSNPEVWSETLGGMPEGLGGNGTLPSRGEWAAHVALTLYAIHVQSDDSPVQEDGVGLGRAVGRLAATYEGSSDDSNPYQKRMAEASRSDDIETLAWRLRGIVRLLGREGIGLDYGKLAADLYRFQSDLTRPYVVLGWGRGYSAGFQEARYKKDKRAVETACDNQKG